MLISESIAMYSVETVRQNPQKIFVFGDNLLRRGRGGQAVIRFEENSFGIPTKRSPGMHDADFFSDREDEFDSVKSSLRELYRKAAHEKRIIVFPSAGLGTGLAQMPSRSPRLYEEMCLILAKHFGVAVPERSAVRIPGLASPSAVK